MRARDLDRANASSVLDAAYAEGQLGADEYRDRTAQAETARTVGELERLVDDLQVPSAVADLVSSESTPPRNPLRRAGTGGRYPDHTRARDVDRDTTRQLIDNARGDGQLSEDEHQTLTELAGEAKTLGELAQLVDDLQRPSGAAPPPQPPRSNRRRWYRIAVGAGAVCAAVAAFVLTSGVSDTEPAPATALVVVDLGSVQPLVIATPNLLTREGLTLFLGKYRDKFGDLQIDDLTLYPEYAIVSRAVPGEPNRLIGYDYRGGFQQSSSVTSRKADKAAVDLAQLNVAAISDALASAPSTLRVANGVVTHMDVEINDAGAYSTFGIPKNGPYVTIYAGNKFNESGYLLLTPAGAVARAVPFEK
ncbi:DUF1707 SHOCT-like domain-containing protein [Nocardia sp. CA-084685]|uniref:DUF1707 SHOCT-like domain-containing protein n=1 Tax=Nocardia sp. CA-084685 TaxID=3239970 RepID=UPI003D989CE0